MYMKTEKLYQKIKNEIRLELGIRKVKSSVSALILNRFSIYDANLLINSIFQFRQIL